MSTMDCGACVALTIEQRDGGPEISSLRDVLSSLLARAMGASGVDGQMLPDTPLQQLIVGIGSRTAGRATVENLLDRLADSVRSRNEDLDLSEWLRVTACVGAMPAGDARALAERIAASPLMARVLSAARPFSLVIAVSEVWHAECGPPASGYNHVRSGADTFWVRLPDRSPVRGLAPFDVIAGHPNDIGPAPLGDHRRLDVTVGGDHGSDHVGIKIVSSDDLAGRREPVGVRAPGMGEAPIGGFRDPGVRAVDRPGHRSLGGRRAEALRRALVDAYPSFDELAAMLLEKLHRNLHRLVSPHLRLDVVGTQLVHRAEAEGWVEELVTAAYLGNPGNATLGTLIRSGFHDHDLALVAAMESPTDAVQELLPQAGILVDLVTDGRGDREEPWSGSTLEKIFRRSAAFQDVLPFTARLLAAAGQVCNIRIRTRQGWVGGTGFLIGPDLVLSNHHVMEQLIDGRVPPADVRCVFDHRVDADGVEHCGEAVELAGDGSWFVAASPPSDVDGQPWPTGPPGLDELDYAVVRLAEPIGRSRSFDGRERGWMRLFDTTPTVEAGLPLLIVQHPLGQPQKLAVDADGVLYVNTDRTRLTYHVNTEPGSSGSPCLTFDFDLVALHHSGGARGNEGIPIATIAAHLRAAGLAALFDA